MRVYDYIVVFLIIYIICSIVEYVVHKYIMHLPFPYLRFIYDNHILHHSNATASPDLSLEEDDDNLCLPVDKSFYMYVVAVIISYLTLLLYPKKVPILYTGGCVLFILLFAVLMWNTYHPIIHGLDGRKICGLYSIPSKYINVNSTYSDYAINNHKAHHYYKNDEKGNFNITLPFADFLFGSYKSIPN